MPTCANIPARESRSRQNIVNTLFVAGNELRPAQYDVVWVSNSPEATVIFKAKGKVAAAVQGKIVKVGKKFDHDSTLSAKDSIGREDLKAIQFGGKQIRIVFE